MPGREGAIQYRARAQQCIEIAQDMDPPRRLILLEMARVWMRLAQQAERNQKNDLVYETSPRSHDHGRSTSGDRRGDIGWPLTLVLYLRSL